MTETLLKIDRDSTGVITASVLVDGKLATLALGGQAAPVPVPEAPPREIIDLAKAVLESGTPEKPTEYVVKVGQNLTKTVTLGPELHDIVIDFGDAVIDSQAAPGIHVTGTNIALLAGQWRSKSRTSAVFLDGVDNSLTYAVDDAGKATPVRFLGGGGLVITRAIRDAQISGVETTGLYDDNLIYAGGHVDSGKNAQDIEITEITDAYGSTAENGIRTHATDGLIGRNWNMTGSYRGAPVRVHDGTDVDIENITASKGILFGPLSETDGGEGDGLAVDANNKPVIPARLVGPGEKDYKGRVGKDATDRRAKKLALRLERVNVREIKINGPLSLNAGIVDLTIDGGTIDNPRNQPLDIEWSYPSKNRRIKDEELRPAVTGVIRNVQITDDNGQLSDVPFGLTLEGVKINGKAVVAGKVSG